MRRERGLKTSLYAKPGDRCRAGSPALTQSTGPVRTNREDRCEECRNIVGKEGILKPLCVGVLYVMKTSFKTESLREKFKVGVNVVKTL